MSRPAASSWRRAFLRELARTGSVAAGADRAGIDRSSVYQLRRRNLAFAASWDRALEAANERLAGESAVTGMPRETLRLRADETVRASRTGRPCIMRVGPGRWSGAAEEAFLGELCATANVKAAAAAAGVSTQAAYARRRKWPAFAQAWEEARAEGYLRLELMLINAATTSLDPPVVPTGTEPPPMSYSEAMQVMKLRGAGHGPGRARRHAWRAGEPDIEDVRSEVLRKLAVLERARGGHG